MHRISLPEHGLGPLESRGVLGTQGGRAVQHPGFQHIAGDTYHMQSGDGHVAHTLLQYAPQMANLHLADSNRRVQAASQPRR